MVLRMLPAIAPGCWNHCVFIRVLAFDLLVILGVAGYGKHINHQLQLYHVVTEFFNFKTFFFIFFCLLSLQTLFKETTAHITEGI